MSFASEKTPLINFGCKLVPVLYREYNYGPLVMPKFHEDVNGFTQKMP